MPNKLSMVLREAAQKDGPATAVEVFREGVKTGRINRHDFSLRETAQTFMGDQWADKLTRFAKSPYASLDQTQLREAGAVDGVIDASAFSAITGQLLIDRVRDKYELATKVGNEIFETSPITNGNLGPQREPRLGRVRTFPDIVQPGMPYPTTGYDPTYVDYVGPEKFGEICHVTMEHVFSDLTGQVNESADSVGEVTGMFEEYKKLCVFLGAVNNHSWNGTTYNTYLTSGSWTNANNAFTLTDYRSMNTLEQLFVNMVDPDTGLPIRIGAKNVFVMPTAKYTARRILNATWTRSGNGASDTGVQFEAANPIDGYGDPLTSPHARNIAVNGWAPNGGASGTNVSAPFGNAARADSMIIVGDFKKAFRWRQVFPVKVVQAPPQNQYEFAQDIVMSVKASGYGVAVVKDPRYVVMGWNNSL